MKVKEIMTKKVTTVSEKANFKKIAKIIFQGKFSGIPVIDKNKYLLGIISEKDLLQALYPSYQELFEDWVHAKNFEAIRKRAQEVAQKKAADLMKKKVITVSPETHIMEACSKMILNRVRRLPVVDENGRLKGIVSQGDIFRAILKEEFKFKK